MATTTTDPAPPAAAPELDPDRFDRFVGRFVDDLGTILHAATVLLGDELGLYDAMGDGAPISAADLADRTGLAPREVLEWLNAQAAAAYVDHDPDTDRYRLPAEHAAVLVSGRSPINVPGA